MATPDKTPKLTPSDVERLTREQARWVQAICDFGRGGSRGIYPSFVAHDAKHADGVLYHGGWGVIADGFSEHIRRCARALAATGVPLHLRDTTYRKPEKDDERDLAAEFDDLVDVTIGRFVVRIYQGVASPTVFENIAYQEYQVARGGLTKEQLDFLNSRKIVSTVFERTVADREQRALSKFGQVWVACQRNAEELRATCAGRVHVIPVPYFPNDPLLKLDGRPFDVGRRPRFYHIGKWEPRKEQHTMLGAFMRAFRPSEATLCIKTSPFTPPRLERYPRGPEESIGEWLKDPTVQANGWNEQTVGGSLFVIRKILPTAKLRELHASCDCYVSLSRGEGFDMPARDAKLAGNLLVYTAAGGTEDHAGDQDEMVPTSWAAAECHEFYGWRGQRYADYQLDDAARALRRAWEKLRRGIRVRGRTLREQQADAVGIKMRMLVEQLAGDDATWRR